MGIGNWKGREEWGRTDFQTQKTMKILGITFTNSKEGNDQNQRKNDS